MFIGFYERCQVSHAVGNTGAQHIGNHSVVGTRRKSAFDPSQTLAKVGWILVSGNNDLLGQPVHIQDLMTGPVEERFD